MNLSKKQLRDITRTALGFTGVLCAAAALIWLGNRNDAVTNAESLKAGILTAHQVKAAFETVSGRLVDRPIEEGMTLKRARSSSPLTAQTLAFRFVRRRR